MGIPHIGYTEILIAPYCGPGFHNSVIVFWLIWLISLSDELSATDRMRDVILSRNEISV